MHENPIHFFPKQFFFLLVNRHLALTYNPKKTGLSVDPVKAAYPMILRLIKIKENAIRY